MKWLRNSLIWAGLVAVSFAVVFRLESDEGAARRQAVTAAVWFTWAILLTIAIEVQKLRLSIECFDEFKGAVK